MGHRVESETEDDEEATMLLRLTVGVKRAAKEVAQGEGKSLNEWVMDAIACAAGMRAEPVTKIVGHRWRK